MLYGYAHVSTFPPIVWLSITFSVILSAIVCTLFLIHEKIGFSVFRVTTVIWILASSWVAIRFGFMNVGFTSLFVAMFATFLDRELKLDFSKSYLAPQLTWYEGLPRNLPGVFSTEVITSEASNLNRLNLGVCRFDSEGVAVFLNDRRESQSVLPSQIRVRIDFQSLSIELDCGLVRTFLGGRVGGYIFNRIQGDQLKALKEIVEQVRKYGYA